LFQETTYLVNILLNTSSWMKWALLLHFMNSSNGLRPSPIFHIFHNHGTPSNHILCWTSYWTLSKYPLCSYALTYMSMRIAARKYTNKRLEELFINMPACCFNCHKYLHVH
jgi:hypothetical protein